MTEDIIQKVIDAIDIPDKYFFTPKQSAGILQIPEKTVWDYIKKYKILFAVRLVYQYRIPRAALEHFIRRGMECVFDDCHDRMHDRNGDEINPKSDFLNFDDIFPDKNSFNKEELGDILQISERSLNNYIKKGFLIENESRRLERNNIIQFLETMK